MKKGTIYRYRSIKRLLGNNELKDHYFYLTPSTNENDINEGHPILYLKGPALMWKGIFRYYYLYIYRHYYDGIKDLDDITNDTKFINSNVVNEFISKILPGYKIYLYQLNYVLSKIDIICSKYILMTMVKNQIIKGNMSLNQFITQYHQLINMSKYNDFLYSHLDVEAERKLFKSHSHKNMGFDLFLRYASYVNFYYITKHHQQTKFSTYLKFMNYHKLFLHKKLPELVLPKMYIVSCSDRYDNDDMWANYADKYNGACLEFYTLDKSPVFNNKLTRKIFSFGNKRKKYLCKVRYTNKFPKYNMFKYFNLENGLDLNPIINNRNNNLLEFLFKEIFSDHEGVYKYFLGRHSWKYYTARRLYMCSKSVTTKNKDWQSEGEYRLIYFDDAYHNYTKNCRQTYEFKMLKSVTLGINVSLSDEAQIIDIITNQCKKEHISNFPIYKIVRKRNGKLGRNIFWIVNPVGY